MFKVGDKVEVLEGCFRGETGLVVEVNEDSCCVSCSTNNYNVYIDFAEDKLELHSPPTKSILPDNANQRKTFPIYSGCLNYFPDALALVARRSYIGNQQHHPDKPLHWDMSKSSDELDALQRHIIDEDWDCVAWRALANLQRKINDGWRPDDWGSIND